METFKFNFNVSDEQQILENDSSHNSVSRNENSEQGKNRPNCCEIAELIVEQKKEATDVSELELIADIKIDKVVVNLDKAAELLRQDDVREKDLVKGEYEGGFKLWEGALDLANYLIEIWKLKYSQQGQGLVQGGDMKDKKVMELGCGHGIPGIVAAMCGAEVHFQDFNQQVLENVTQINVYNAVNKYKLQSITRFFSGNWELFVEFCAKNYLTASYDVILAAETIYDITQYKAFLECIKTLLQPPNGVAYICAKSYYFGVGGGVAEFIKFVQKDGILTSKIVRSIDDQQGNKRQIIMLKFPDILQPYFS